MLVVNSLDTTCLHGPLTTAHIKGNIVKGLNGRENQTDGHGSARGPETDKQRLALCFRRLHSPHDTGTLSERERPEPPAWAVLDDSDMMCMRD